MNEEQIEEELYLKEMARKVDAELKSLIAYLKSDHSKFDSHVSLQAFITMAATIYKSTAANLPDAKYNEGAESLILAFRTQISREG